ncbi:LysR substrate-binding domain-containing protein [Rhizobium sp. WYJ-E13]|uniref:LysR substrate-binding domain-containing protein n=1 Tax=Rhizobium sp. WYJ-E13 TaxID=2849093 RepID=UPI0020A70602|nr:LysR substrate-binding domain-containing protein [Rhizobium sp. WYJ-E13]
MTNGTASRAGEVLRVSQPAVSKAIQELERIIGFALFDRIKGRMLPTAEGRLFFREVSGAFSGLVHLRSAAARIRDFGSGEIRIASLSALSTNIVPKALRAFHARHPDVAITLQARMSSVVKDLVAGGQFDVGLAADEIDVAGVESRPFAQYRAAVAMPSGHRLAERQMIEPKDLDGQTFIALSPEDTTRRQADLVFAEHGAKPKIVLETPYSTTICAMVQSGLGVGLIHPLTADPYLGQALVTRPFSAPVHFRTLLLLPPDRRPSRIVAGFIEELMRQSRFED